MTETSGRERAGYNNDYYQSHDIKYAERESLVKNPNVDRKVKKKLRNSLVFVLRIILESEKNHKSNKVQK